MFFVGFIYECTAQDFTRTGHGVKLTVNSITTELRFYNTNTVRVLKYPAGKEADPKSLSVIAAPAKTDVSVKSLRGTLNIDNGHFQISVNLGDGNITFSERKNKMVLLKEKTGSVSFQPFNDAGVSTYTVNQAFELGQDEAIYGLGQQQRGKMIQRNLKMLMVQGNTDDYVPFFQSVKGYGIFWDNYSPTTFEDNTTATSFKSEVGDCIDYYFMYGANADGVIAQMRNLTGQAPMFPLWTYGYWQSKERYKSQFELVDVVKKHRQLNVPLDGVIQDWQYWGSNYLWNAMDFLNADFPDPKRMVKDIRQMNAHMIISIWSSFGPHTLQYKELDKINALFNIRTWPESGSDIWPPKMEYPSGVRVYDAYNPAARDIYWKYLRNMHSLGIDGWWMDSSEPDHFSATDADLNTKTYLGSFRRVRNA
ncbi:MAG: DUF4968 domain-containing protein, partial [Chitinophagaceae bacterium]|nr:DUF4968 domain-containing protein [Chitinophagaceae bacterium]